MMVNWARHWYRPSLTWLTFLLLPLSYLFRLIVVLRLFLYRYHVIKTVHFPVPVIIVGNITVGGTGKTPLVIWLATFLKKHGWRPGIVSRGMGGVKQLSPMWVDAYLDPQVVGDEAILLARHSACPTVVCIDRVAAVRALLSATDCNIVLSDDGLQHYRLGRAVEIAVVDGDRQLGNRRLLPAGPLREIPQRLNQTDFIIQQGGKKNKNYFHMQLQGKELFSLADFKNKKPFTHFKHTKIHAVAGVGNPQRFFSVLRENELDIIEHVFPDHYLYQEEDLDFSDALPIIMTEKDKVKCEGFANNRLWYLPVTAELDTEFERALLERISTHSGNHYV